MKTELFEASLRICEASLREWMRTPRAVTIDGRSGAFVTTGHSLLMAWGEPAAEPEQEPPMPPSAIPFLTEMLTAKRRHTDTVSLRELTAWIGPSGCKQCRYTLKLRCPECHGSRNVAHNCDCQHCQYTGAEDCEACGATGKIGCECDRTEGCLIFGQYFDRRILRQALPLLDESVSVDWTGNDTKPLRIRGDGWTVVAMGLRRVDADINKPFPTFSATERTVVA